MTSQNRTTLKTYFVTGARPTQAQFIDLIDSSLNLSDTGAQIITSDVSALGKVEFRKDITVSGNATIGGTLTVGGVPALTASSIATFTNKTYDTAGAGNNLSINGLGVSANTGTGAIVRATLPTLVTPVLGVATGTSLALGGGTALANYLESTWVPVITTTATVGSPAYSIQSGSYTRIGRMVFAQFIITLSGWTGSPTGNVNISGLPIAAGSPEEGYATIYYSVTGLAASNFGIIGRVIAGATVINLYQNSNTADTVITAAQIGSTPTLNGLCVYRV